MGLADRQFGENKDFRELGLALRRILV